RLRFDEMSKVLSHRGPETQFSFDEKNGMNALMAARSSKEHDVSSVETDDSLALVDAPSYVLEGFSSDLDWVTNSHGVLAVRLDQEGIQIERSPDCTRPLYYSINDTSFGFASEKKALVAGGFRNLIVPPPGTRIVFPWNGEPSLIQRLEYEQPRTDRTRTSQEFVNSLRAALLDSFGRLPSSREYGVLFSGGVDSSLVAHLLQSRFEGVKLYAVGTSKSHDTVAAMKAARLMGFESNHVQLDSATVWGVLSDVVRSIESSKRMDVEIALPFFLGARRAQEDGCSILVSGQGPDELFGGYMRHLRLAASEGSAALETQLWKEVSVTHESNIARDEKALGFNGIEAAFPYLFPRFVRLALSIPAEMKIAPEQSPSRKIIFRELADSLGLPTEIINEPKKATQYGSGSAKILMEAIGDFAPECQGQSKKEVDLVVQHVLDRIGIDVGIQMPMDI
ncbi:MAG: asparagine synthase family protein, partial [Candidatus Thorarchaeota archaeon]